MSKPFIDLIPPFFNGGQGGIQFAALLIMLLTACGSLPPDREQATAPAPLAPALAQQYHQALALMARGDYAAAEAPLRALIQARPELAGPHFNLGLIYARTERRAAALSSLQTAARLNPGLAAAHNQMGILQRQRGDFQAARRAYEQALAADPDYAKAHLNLGILYDLYLQQPALALQHYQRYQALRGKEEHTVRLWIVDLRQRLQAVARNEGGKRP